ncbi:MAG TPA: DNA-3-methyladenine glycosylase 2 family protein [Saprospiraceae bacterium]|nr:DNA-3-methyladenine glycosylase 2 family protein [Saprospiraceae bacterium]
MKLMIEDAVAHLSKQEPLAALIARIELPVRQPSGKMYYDLLESIVSQQLSVRVADVIFHRFLALFPDTYPHPDQLSCISMEQLRSAGLSAQKAQYLRNVAQFALEQGLESQDWQSMTDEQIIRYLTQIKGVGVWTVQMLLMFTLGRPDVFPVDDLGIQQGMARLFKIQDTGKALKRTMIELAEPWRPYRTTACYYLWRYKSMPRFS